MSEKRIPWSLFPNRLSNHDSEMRWGTVGIGILFYIGLLFFDIHIVNDDVSASLYMRSQDND